MIERDGLDIRFTMVMYRSIERYFAAHMNFRDIFYWKPYNETRRFCLKDRGILT